MCDWKITGKERLGKIKTRRELFFPGITNIVFSPFRDRKDPRTVFVFVKDKRKSGRDMLPEGRREGKARSER